MIFLQATKTDSIRDIKDTVNTIFKPRTKSLASYRSASLHGPPQQIYQPSSLHYFLSPQCNSSSQDYTYTVSSEEWFQRKGKLPTQPPPNNRYTSCPTLIDPAQQQPSNHQIETLEIQHSQLAAEVNMLRAHVMSERGVATLGSSTSTLKTAPPPYNNNSPDYSSPLQTIAEIADSFSSDMDIYTASIFPAPPKPKRTSPNRSKSSTPASTPPPPSPLISTSCGVDLELSYDVKVLKNRSRPGFLHNRAPSGETTSTEPGRVQPPTNSTPCPSRIGELDISFTCTSLTSLSSRHPQPIPVRRVETPPFLLRAVDSVSEMSHGSLNRNITRNYRGSVEQLSSRGPVRSATRSSLVSRSVV
eukprot:sb/3466059/